MSNTMGMSRRLTRCILAQSRQLTPLRVRGRCFSASTTATNKKSPPNLMLRVGAPFILFSILSAWVVSNALDGKLKEMEASQGKASQSIRQAALEQEHEEMMERLNRIVEQDFDNTKRIKRPHEILEERRKEREKRNAWHRRLYRSVFGDGEGQDERKKENKK